MLTPVVSVAILGRDRDARGRVDEITNLSELDSGDELVFPDLRGFASDRHVANVNHDLFRRPAVKLAFEPTGLLVYWADGGGEWDAVARGFLVELGNGLADFVDAAGQH